MTQPATAERYYQLVLLWPTDHAKFNRYLSHLTPIVEPYGAALERQFSPQTIYAQGLERPETINLVYYASREAFSAFLRDERFRNIVHLRTESTRMASIEGLSTRGAAAAGDSSSRQYLIELARFGAGGEEAYRAYEVAAEPVMARYGYHVERVIRAESVSGLSFTPDIVKVAYFDAANGMDRFHGDVAHAHIETELYPAATSESLWIIARSTSP
jgi:uncharacterized protein (DUF1330 family)